MTNLFSSFDPSSWVSLPLNWLSSVMVLFLLPPLFWLSSSQAQVAVSRLVFTIFKEFKAVMNPFSTPGVLLVSLSLFLLIVCNNSLGLLPYTFTAPSHLMYTVALALPLWIGHMVFACATTSTLVLAHLVPLGTPTALLPFMVIIELISSIIRPLTLSVRLAANMIAGHLLLALLAGQAPHLTWSGLSFLLIGLILLATLECAVSLIQAYVFSILSSLYINEVNSLAISQT